MSDQQRRAHVTRETRETQIEVDLVLDGSGKADIETGIGFFDHMLESFTKHAAFDMKVRTKGDLHIDMHHTVEDTGMVIGSAVREALGNFSGIRRFGHAYIPMDETLTRASIDLCNRPYLVWKVAFARDTVGAIDTELFKEWFHAFAMKSGACVHVENLYGENSHHIVESAYKALARALREGCAPDDVYGGEAPSTKGSL